MKLRIKRGIICRKSVCISLSIKSFFLLYSVSRGSAHEIDFAKQNHKNRKHGPGHPLLPLCGNSPCVSRLLYCFTFPRRAGCPHPAAAWELLDVRVLRVGRGALTPPQTQFVGETLVPRQTYIVSYHYRFPIPSAEHTNTQANFRDFYQFLSCARHGYMV